jgi:phage tail sheath protein FI
MPEYLSPGVYVEEVDTGDKPIEGVSTSTSGLVGVTMRGSVATPSLVTSVADFRRQFGGRLDYHDYKDASYLPLAVEGLFNNGGKRTYIVRVLPDTALYASHRLFDRGTGASSWSTKLASVAAKGDSVILVDVPPGPAAIGATDWFVIEDPAGAEYAQAETATPIVLNSPVLNDIAAGEVITPYTLAANGAAKVLAADAHAGDTSIQVNDITNLAADNTITIDTGLTQELIRIHAPVPANPPLAPNAVLPLYTPLANDHLMAANPPVQRVDATAGATTTTAAVDAPPGTLLLVVADQTQLAGATAIATGAAATEEWHFFWDGGLIASSTPLNLVHRATSRVVVATLNAIATPDPTLVNAASPHDTSLALSDRTNIAQHTVLRLGTAAPYEYVVVMNSGAGAGPVELYFPIRGTYVAGATVHAADDGTGAGAAATFLARPAHPDEEALYVQDVAAFPANTLFRVGDGDLAEYHEVDAASKIRSVTLTSPLIGSHASGTDVARRSVTGTVQAIDRGEWGNCLQVNCADDDPLLDTGLAEDKGAGSPDLLLSSATGIEAGSVLEFYNAAGMVLVQKVSGRSGNKVQFAAPGLGAAVFMATTRVRTREFKVTVQCAQWNPRIRQFVVSPGMSETVRHLSMDSRHSRYFVKAIGPIPALIDGATDGESLLIRVQDSLSPAATQSTTRLGPDTFAFTLTGGDDMLGDFSDAMFIGQPSLDPVERTGLYALQNIEEVSIVAVPGQTSQDVQNAIIDHCELLKYRFGVLDSAYTDTFQKVQHHRDLYDSKYAAFYYPWLQIEDPFPDNPRVPGPYFIPPSGHIIGIYARSDIERGVHKAPANEVIQNIDDLQIHILKEQQDILNPRNINVIRDFRDHQRGLRVWGARCITSDPDWKYVPVRRLFIFLEHSLDNGTQWVVFEPNDQRLWARVRQSITSFLTDVWRSGALMGSTAAQAFFVKCDNTTMTQGDIDNGRLIMVIGVAPVRPAEFVIIRIGQWTGGSMVQEG